MSVAGWICRPKWVNLGHGVIQDSGSKAVLTMSYTHAFLSVQ